MNWLKKLAGLFSGPGSDGRHKGADPGSAPSGFMAFSHTGQVVAARLALLDAGLAPRIKAPPPSLREGCDMVLEFPAELEAVYLAVLEEKRLRPLKVMAVDGPLTAPQSLFTRTDFPGHLMVKAANMKITVDRRSGVVVNVSGGGCPDVPYLASRLMGRVITEAETPAELSRSLCSFSLTQAKEEAARLFAAGLPAGPEPLPADSAPRPPLPWPRRRPRPLPRPWLVVGTLADPGAALGEGSFQWQDGRLWWRDEELPCERGTAALMAAYAVCARWLGLPPGRAVLAGDDGRGDGSRAVYGFILDRLPLNPWSGLTFHYLFPEAASHDRIFLAAEALPPAERPLLAADAGFMYVAKMCGQAEEYDLFTPDAGELAYLADPEAPHPFYTRGALIQAEPGPEMIAETYRHGNAARTMLVKGRSDRIVWRGKTVHQVDGPLVPSLEAVGGTGDTATGLASAFLAAGFRPPRAAALAAHLNRRAGLAASPGPEAGIGRLVAALEETLTATPLPNLAN